MKKRILTDRKVADRLVILLWHGVNKPSLCNYINHNFLIPLFVIVTILFSSCSHYYYVSNTHNVPLFKEKNEFRFSGAVGGGIESTSIEIQSAYAVSDRIGIMADFMSAYGGNDNNTNCGKGTYFEGAIGYYKPIGKYAVFEIYGGLGRSNQHHEYSDFYYNQSYGSADLSFTKLLIQPSFGLTLNFLDIAFSSRLSSVSFNNIHNNIYGNVDYFNKLNSLSDNSHFFIEPAVTLRAGWKSVKLQFQAELIRCLNEPDLYISEEYHVSLGIYCAFGKRFR
jgi:hypothetical protein